MIRCFWLFLLVGVLAGCATDSVLVRGAGNDDKKPAVSASPTIETSTTSSTNSSTKEITIAKDLWERLRTGFDIPDPDEEIINKQIQLLQAKSDSVNRVLERSANYLYYIIEEVEARDLPSELALLPFVESAFNPKAVSPAKAVGMWQFMPATGKSFNLKQNMFIDERGDIVKSTRAALEYLQRLHDQFGDWHLALAAYNWGEGSVTRAITRNQNANLNTDYFHLTMPKETKNYVPRLLAYKRIIESPEKYGFQLPKLPNHPYFVEVPVVQDIDLDKVVELSDMTRDQFIALNPSFTKPVILKEFNYSILLPYGKAEIFKYNLASHQKPLSSWTAVKVHKTDTVEKIARANQVKPTDLRVINNIPLGMKVRSGSSLLIPKTEDQQGNIDADIAHNGLLMLEKEFTPVAVKMQCHDKKCTAVPRNLANYVPSKGNASSKSNVSAVSSTAGKTSSVSKAEKKSKKATKKPSKSSEKEKN